MLVAKVGSRYLSPDPDSSITMTTGVVWDHPTPDWTVPAAYAGAICSMTRNLALDLKPVRVNAVSPGLVDTAFWDGPLTAEQKDSLLRATVQGFQLGESRMRRILRRLIFI